MRFRTRSLLALGLALAVAAPLLAHHSFSAEYGNDPANLKGAVTKIEWQNPHVFFYIDVRDEATGKVTNWALEMGAPAVIQRNGWTRNTMKIGDMVSSRDQGEKRQAARQRPLGRHDKHRQEAGRRLERKRHAVTRGPFAPA